MPTLGEIRRAREAGKKLSELGTKPTANIGTAFGQDKVPATHRRNTGIRHKRQPPAFAEFGVSEAQHARQRRAELMERRQELEWKFDRNPTLALVKALQAVRAEISSIEEQVVIQTELGRSRQAVEALQQLVNGGTKGG